MKSKKTCDRTRKIIVYALLGIGVVVFGLPFAWLIRSSFMTTGQIFRMPPEWIPRPFRWQNYPEALTAYPFLRYFANTMTILIPVVTGTVITGSMAAFAFSRLQWRGRDLFFFLILTTLMLPYAVTLIPTFILWKTLGGVDTYFPLIVPWWFGGGAFNIFLLRQFFSAIPIELDEAAYLDGATPWQVLWKIILPLSKPAIITVALFAFMNVWSDLVGPVIYLHDPNKYTLAVGLASFVGVYTGRWNYLMAASVAVMAPPVIVFFIGQKYFMRGIVLTGSREG